MITCSLLCFLKLGFQPVKADDILTGILNLIRITLLAQPQHRQRLILRIEHNGAGGQGEGIAQDINQRLTGKGCLYLYDIHPGAFENDLDNIDGTLEDLTDHLERKEDQLKEIHIVSFFQWQKLVKEKCTANTDDKPLDQNPDTDALAQYDPQGQ